MNDETYVITIERKNTTEFSATISSEPSDAFGRRMIAMLLSNMVCHFDPSMCGEGGSDEGGGPNVQLDNSVDPVENRPLAS